MQVVGTYRVFSRDVTAAMLVSLTKGTSLMLVTPTTFFFAEEMNLAEKQK